MVSSTLTSALVATVLFLGSTSAYTEQPGSLGKTNGKHGIVQCICYTDFHQDAVNYADSKNACKNLPNGEQYPHDPYFIGECIFHTYEDRRKIVPEFWKSCTSHWAQCCSTQGNESGNQCSIWGPAKKKPSPGGGHHPPGVGHHPPGEGHHPPGSDSKPPALFR